MSWEFQTDRPIYAQIMLHIQLDIVSGKYAAGEKLPSVRELAAEAAVNPNTMQKAMTELERLGLVYSQRTSGRFITEDEIMIQSIKQQLAQEQIQNFLQNMQRIGYAPQKTLHIVEQAVAASAQQ